MAPTTFLVDLRRMRSTLRLLCQTRRESRPHQGLVTHVGRLCRALWPPVSSVGQQGGMAADPRHVSAEVTLGRPLPQARCQVWKTADGGTLATTLTHLTCVRLAYRNSLSGLACQKHAILAATATHSAAACGFCPGPAGPSAFARPAGPCGTSLVRKYVQCGAVQCAAGTPPVQCTC